MLGVKIMVHIFFCQRTYHACEKKKSENDSELYLKEYVHD